MRRPRPLFVAPVICVLILLAGGGAPAFAQIGTAAVRGVVVDSAGAPVSDARVEVRHVGTGARVVALADREGRYHAANVEPGGPYSVVVSRIGYAAVAREDVHLQAGGTLRLDFELRAEAVLLAGVAVRAEDGVFDATRTGAATVVDGRRVATLPTAAALTQILTDHGFDGGDYGVVTLENPINNLFARLDWQPHERHRLTLRYSHAGARDDVGPHRQGFGPYGLSSHGYRQRTESHGIATRLASALGGGVSNELTINWLRLHDAVAPASDLPEVEVRASSVVEAGGVYPVSRWVRAGGNPIAQANELDQALIEVRNDLTRR